MIQSTPVINSTPVAKGKSVSRRGRSLAPLRYARIGLAGLLVACSPDGPQTPAKRPLNVLVVIVDDLSSAAVGAFGGELIETPNLDRLTARGTAFRRTICSTPFCTPSRQSFLTGRWPHAIGVTQIKSPLNPEYETMATVFSRAGYRTGAFGKMHWQGKQVRGDETYGFEEHLNRKHWEAELSSGDRAIYDEYRKMWSSETREGWSTLNPDRQPCPLAEERQLAPWLIDRALEFMESGKAPTLTYLSFYEPHAPFNFPTRLRDAVDVAEIELPDWEDPKFELSAPGHLRQWRSRLQSVGPISAEELRGIIASCLQSVLWLDEQIGQLLDRLDETGLSENTLVLFWSDNGFFLGERGLVGKNYPFRRAAEVAMSLSGPGIPRGETFALVQTIDAFPTLCELTGIPVPEQTDGRSLLPLLHGEDSIREFVYSEFIGVVGMLQTERWKLMVGAKAGQGWDLLYDLEHDPEESVNLFKSPEHARTVVALRKQMHGLMLATPPIGYPRNQWMQQENELQALRWSLSRIDSAR